MPAAAFRFAIAYDAALEAGPLDGRLLVLVSTEGAREPRFQIHDGPETQLVLGVDMEAWKPGEEAVVGEGADAWPLERLADLPAGSYVVQAVLHRYETFHRADGHTLKLPMDRGEGQQWHRAPGNLVSAPREVAIDPAEGGRVRIALDRVLPPAAAPVETRYLRYERIRSPRLTRFWGRPMHLGAHVLVPDGFDEHPEARFPLAICHGHFPETFEGFREAPPDAGLEPEHSERFDWPGYNLMAQEHAHRFYRQWTAPGYPRLLLVQLQHANPYYDDSYAVNSANMGPYGDAIVYELLPHLERTYRGLGQGWARFLYGGSTGGWAALAAQILYPDEFNGCFAACPDPVDFRAFTLVNLYEDRNAYWLEGPWTRVPRPGRRSAEGQVLATIAGMNRLEAALGSRGRSGQQWDAWQAVYSPVGADGYPRPIWDKRTGAIDREVAAHWREHYDLCHILRRDWAALGPRLKGKIHVTVGTKDDFFLEGAVQRLEAFLAGTSRPHYGGVVRYGEGAGHCWNGDPVRPYAIARLRYHQMVVPQIVDRMLRAAPAGADLTSWRY